MKTAMIWGAGGGIGGALLEKLQDRGWNVIAVNRTPLTRPDTTCLEADVSKPFEVEKAVFEAAMETDRVNLWIYAAGDIVSEKTAQMGPGTWAQIMDANLSGAFSAAHYSLPLLAEDAALVFIGAVSERMRLPGLGAYAAAKAGLEAFAESLTKEERKKQVIIVRPAAVDTAFWEKVPFKLPKGAASPEKVAGKILEAVESGHQGLLDLT